MNQEALEQRIAALETIIEGMQDQLDEVAERARATDSLLEDFGIVEGFRPPWAKR